MLGLISRDFFAGNCKSPFVRTRRVESYGGFLRPPCGREFAAGGASLMPPTSRLTATLHVFAAYVLIFNDYTPR